MQFAWEEKGIIHLKSEKCAWLATLVFTQSSKCNLWNWKLKTENLRIRFFKLSIQTRWRCQFSCKHVGDKRAAAKKDQKILFSNFSAFLDSFWTPCWRLMEWVDDHLTFLHLLLYKKSNFRLLCAPSWRKTNRYNELDNFFNAYSSSNISNC